MKMAPILRAIEARGGMSTELIHTGQHYDESLSDVFFRELNIRKPDVFLGIGSGTHGQQTADILVAIERQITVAAERGAGWDATIVVGDVNSTVAAAIASVKLNVPVVHVEAGCAVGIDRCRRRSIDC